MYDNWTEIIEIMKPILDLRDQRWRSKWHLKVALERLDGDRQQDR